MACCLPPAVVGFPPTTGRLSIESPLCSLKPPGNRQVHVTLLDASTSYCSQNRPQRGLFRCVAFISWGGFQAPQSPVISPPTRSAFTTSLPPFLHPSTAFQLGPGPRQTNARDRSARNPSATKQPRLGYYRAGSSFYWHTYRQVVEGIFTLGWKTLGSSDALTQPTNWRFQDDIVVRAGLALLLGTITPPV